MNKVIAGIAVLALALGAYGTFAAKQAPVQEPLGGQSTQVTDGNCTLVNGLHRCPTSRSLGIATTTPCSVLSPSATSTLVRASVQVNVASSTATVWTLAKATTAFATTTGIGSYSLSSGARGTMTQVATSTASAVDGVYTVAPNSYVNWGLAGVDKLTSDKLTGTCSAEFVY